MDPLDISRSQWDADLRQLAWRMAAAAAFMAGVTAVGILGYRLIAPEAGWVDAFYMTAITLTTVGFGEIIDLEGNPGGRLFTAGLILVGMGGVLYFVSTATAFVLEGQLGHVFRRRTMEKALAAMEEHVIVCGSGTTAAYIVDELVSVRRQVVMIAEGAGPPLRRPDVQVPVIGGDPSSDEILLAAGVERAAGLVACTDNDKENLVITLSARQLNARLRIVARVMDIEAEKKVRKAGADAVVSPNYIGGLRMASEMIRPTVVSFLDTMLRDRDLNLRIDEVTIPIDSPAVGKTLDALGMPDISRALLLAVRTRYNEWHYHPEGTLQVTPGLVLILLGSPEDVRRVCEALSGSVIAPPLPLAEAT